MEKFTMKTQDGIAANIASMKKLFPEIVTEGKIDFEQLKTILGEEIAGDERYQFTWAGKSDAMYEASTPTTKTLRPCVEESKDWENTKNIYIEGDNLEALKILQNTYGGKVKMIYIDPPYNTGHDFIYHDNFHGTKQQELIKEGTVDAETGERFKVNSESNGHFHSDWCSMMYPRLKLARNLLRDDGVLFMSIDDNEVVNARKLCDEVFGESNFLCEFPRVTKKGGKSSSEIARNHDFIVMYTRNRDIADLCGIEHNDEGYSCKDEFFEERGFYKVNQTLDYDSLGWVQSLDYPIIIDGETFYAGGSKDDYEKRQRGQHGRADWGWRWSYELFEFGLNNGFIEVHRGGARPRIYTKTYQKVKIEKVCGEYKIVNIERTKPLSTLEFTDNKYSNDNAKSSFEELMGSGIFDYTKPCSLIMMLTRLVPDKSSLVLDFFSGSATTAHAVMQLNAEDGGNRKFIMVQLPEVCAEGSEAAKAGYKNICEIGKERIRRAGEKIKEENATTAQNLDVGFRVFKVDSSNMDDIYFQPLEVQQQDMIRAINNVKTDRNALDLLFGSLLEWGLPIDLPITKRTDLGNDTYDVDGGRIIASFDSNVGDAAVKAIANEKPDFAIFRDLSFSNSASKINVGEIFKAISPNTEVKVL